MKAAFRELSFNNLLKDDLYSDSVLNSHYCSLRKKLLSNHLQHKQQLVESLGRVKGESLSLIAILTNAEPG